MKNRRTAPTHPRRRVLQGQLAMGGFQACPRELSLASAHKQRVAEALVKIVRRLDIREKIFSQGWQVAGTSPEGLANRVRTDACHMQAVIERNPIRPQ